MGEKAGQKRGREKRLLLQDFTENLGGIALTTEAGRLPEGQLAGISSQPAALRYDLREKELKGQLKW